MSSVATTLLTWAAVLSLLRATSAAPPSEEVHRSFRPGHVSPLLYVQSLSHFAFHAEVLQKTLANPYSPSRVAIVGVEYGRDVAHFARSSYDVIAVEPLPTYVSHLRSLIRDHPDWSITLHAVAAGNPSGSSQNVTISYGENVEKTVPLRKLDDLVKGENRSLAVLSIDIQGDELDVLRGAKAILRNGAVQTVWVEGIACNDKVKEVLKLLDRSNYAIMDFVPWGRPKQQKDTDGPPKTIDSFVFSNDRPSKFDDYLQWMCDARKKSFKWLQTDFVAVHRDVLEDVLSTLLNLADVCDFPKSNCVLRQLRGLSQPPPTESSSQQASHEEAGQNAEEARRHEGESEDEFNYEYDPEEHADMAEFNEKEEL